MDHDVKFMYQDWFGFDILRHHKTPVHYVVEFRLKGQEQVITQRLPWCNVFPFIVKYGVFDG